MGHRYEIYDKSPMVNKLMEKKVSRIKLLTWYNIIAFLLPQHLPGQLFKTETLVRYFSEDYGISALGSMSLRFGFDASLLELNLYRQQWELHENLRCATAPWQSPCYYTWLSYTSIQTAHIWIVTRARVSQVSQHSKASMTYISASGSNIQKILDQT